MNPLEDFIEDYGQVQEKTAFDWKGIAKSDPGLAAVRGAAVAGTTALMGGAALAASKIYDAATKARDFRNMMAYNPDLQEHHERDPRMFNQMFTSLRNMNPAFSKDPLVSGTYMRQMSDNPLTAGGKLTETISSRDKFHSPIGRLLEESATAGSGAFGASMKAQAEQKKTEKPIAQGGGYTP